MNKLKQKFLVICIFILSSCNVGQRSLQSMMPLTGLVNIGHVSSIPYSSDPSNYVLLPIQNNTNQNLYLSSIKVVQNNMTLLADKYLDATNCNIILSNHSCYLKIYANISSGYLINVIYATLNDHKIELKQLINFSSNLPQDNGGVIVSGQDHWLSATSDLSIPVLLNKPYSKIEAIFDYSSLPVSCAQSSKNLPNMCTVVIPAVRTPNKNGQLTIRLYNDNLPKPMSYTIKIANNSSANIISSVINPTINPSNGNSPVSVTLFNNGTAMAESLKIFGVTPIQMGSSTCGDSLNVSQTCSFQINTTSALSGQSSIIISYTNRSGIQILSINVSYVSEAASPLLILTPSGSFTNQVINQGNIYLTVNIKNAGNSAIYNLQFNNINTVNSAMNSFVVGSTCSNGITLGSGSSCNMVLSYKPTSVESGTVTLISTGNYFNQSGQLQTYSNSSLVIPYSSISSAIFKAVGDFGMVVSSPAGASGTWTANVDSPFTTITASANNILINNGLYIMTLNDGSIKYSSLNGLFWQNSLLGNGATFNSSTCSVIFDGTYYYTCGTVGSVFNTVCNMAGRGCAVRTNNLSNNWIPVFTPVQVVPINDIFYFDNGIKNAYVATLANVTANSGLATSTNGSSWIATSSGQVLESNNNFTPVAINATGNTLSTWSSSGFSSSGAISDVSRAWTSNSVSVANSKVTSVVREGTRYSLTLASGKIYSSVDLSSLYTLRYDGNVALNRIIYAANIVPATGTYLAVGDNGANITATKAGSGSNWTARTPIVIGQATIPNLTGVFYESVSNNVWITGVSALLKSNNAIDWTTPGLKSITKNGSSYLAVDNQGNIYSSGGGSSWTQLFNPSAKVLNSIYCVSQNTCFAVGESGTILKSTNGTIWSQLISGVSVNLRGVTCRNGVCIVVGGGGVANSGTILTSNDYNNWSIVTTSLATTNLNSIQYYDNSYIAVGNNGTVFTSVNLLNWESVTSGTIQNLNSIACGDSIGCAVVGNAGVIMFYFGNSWSLADSATSNDLLSVTYNGVFVAVGKSSTLRYSAIGRGVTWSTAIFPSTSSNLNNLNSVISD